MNKPLELFETAQLSKLVGVVSELVGFVNHGWAVVFEVPYFNGVGVRGKEWHVNVEFGLQQRGFADHGT